MAVIVLTTSATLSDFGLVVIFFVRQRRLVDKLRWLLFFYWDVVWGKHNLLHGYRIPCNHLPKKETISSFRCIWTYSKVSARKCSRMLIKMVRAAEQTVKLQFIKTKC